jgi:hypothetical protein
MDRLPITLAACGLGLIWTASGCRNVSDVPHGRPFGTSPPPALAPVGTEAEPRSIGFGSQPHSSIANGFPDGSPGSTASAAGSQGVASPRMNPYEATPPVPPGFPDESKGGVSRYPVPSPTLEPPGNR